MGPTNTLLYVDPPPYEGCNVLCTHSIVYNNNNILLPHFVFCRITLVTLYKCLTIEHNLGYFHYCLLIHACTRCEVVRCIKL